MMSKLHHFVIKELEDRDAYTPLFSIEVEGREEQVRLMGIIDRVDIHQNKTRIVDYKTGKDQLSMVILKDCLMKKGRVRTRPCFKHSFTRLFMRRPEM
jgi:RecB family exonuclease